MIKLKDTIVVTPEKLAYGSCAIARYADERFVVFVEDALPDETLRVEITSLNKKFARAKIVEIIEPSKHRIKPYCPLYNACGACEFQICDYDYLIELKQEVLKDIFEGLSPEIRPVIKSPKIKEYRHKIQYPTRETKNSKRVLMGYFKQNSHDLTNIKYCPAAHNSINEIAKFIRENYFEGCYDEKKHKGLLRNILFRLNLSGELLLTFVVNSKKKTQALDELSEKLMQEFPKIKGIFLNLNPEKINRILGKETLKLKGEDYIIETLKDKKFKIGATSFFQVNPEAAEKLFDVIKENIEQNSTVLDAYGGVGAIGVWVSDCAKSTVLVEQSTEAVKYAKENYEMNNLKNYEILEGDAAQYFREFKKENRTFNYIILDPPRAGCDKEGLEAIADISDNIIYVSCNPETLRRDMIYLIEKGFKPQFVQGVDLFPYTHHIESVCLFKK